jgi:hypothetical protein
MSMPLLPCSARPYDAMVAKQPSLRPNHYPSKPNQ